MTGPSLVAVASALAFILGLFMLFTWAVKRFGPVRAARGTTGGIEVLSRAGLGPRQGVATIRVGDRIAVVSYGEGGVRYLMEVEPEPEVAEASAAQVEEDGSARFASVLGRASRKVAGLRALSLGLVLAATLAGPGPIGAQEGSEGAPAVVGAPDVTPDPGALPQLEFNLGGADGEGLQLSGPVGTVLFIGFMTLIPTLLLLMTGFTRILIVLHLLKQALGTQTAPPAHLLSAMALLLTGFVMAPTFEQVNRNAIQPWMNGEMDQVQALKAASGPMRDFMLGATREQDLAAFVAMRDAPAPETIDDVPMVVLTSAFVTSELTSAFQMGFALFLPFLVIDVVVASVLMSMGMFMLPPVMVSLPFKLLLFVLVDGWSLVMSSLVQSF